MPANPPSLSTQDGISLSAQRISFRDLIETVRRDLNATSCTFYAEDPIWPGEFRLAYMSGVRNPEPMFGFLTPPSARAAILEGEAERFLTNIRKKHSTKKVQATARNINSCSSSSHRLFGDFAEREGIVSSFRFISKRGSQPVAVLFMNWSHKPFYRNANTLRLLRNLMKDLTTLRDEIRDDLKTKHPFPAKEVLSLLKTTETLSVGLPFSHVDIGGPDFGPLVSAVLQAYGLTKNQGIVTLHLFEPRDRSLYLKAISGHIAKSKLKSFQRQFIDSAHGVISWVAWRRRSLLVTNFSKSEFREFYQPTREGICSEIAVPMLAGQSLVGVLNVESTKVDAFPEDTVRALWYVANHAAAVWQNFKTAERNHKLLEICSNAPTAILRPSPLNALAEIARESLDASQCDIWHFDDELKAFCLVGATYYMPQSDEPPRRNGWSRYVLQNMTPVRLEGFRHPDGFSASFWDASNNQWSLLNVTDRPDLHPATRQMRIDGELGLPICPKEGECIAVAWLKFERGDDLISASSALEIAIGLAGQMALVLALVVHQRRMELASNMISAAEKGWRTCSLLGQYLEQCHRLQDVAGILAAAVFHITNGESRKVHTVLREMNEEKVLTLRRDFAEDLCDQYFEDNSTVEDDDFLREFIFPAWYLRFPGSKEELGGVLDHPDISYDAHPLQLRTCSAEIVGGSAGKMIMTCGIGKSEEFAFAIVVEDAFSISPASSLEKCISVMLVIAALRFQSISRGSLENEMAKMVAYPLRTKACLLLESAKRIEVLATGKLKVEIGNHMKNIEVFLRTGELSARSLGADFIQPTEFDICEAVESVRLFVNDPRVSVSSSCHPMWLNGDPDRIKDALLEIIRNALFFVNKRYEGNTSRGHVSVHLEKRSGGRVNVTIDDDGTGIKREDVKRNIFGMFYTYHGEGIGLGLFYVQQIMNAHGGQVRLVEKDDDEEGARFCLEFPGRRMQPKRA